MAIKTDAMIAHNGADGYTIHVEYDPSNEEFNATAVFNDGTEKDLSGGGGGGAEFDALINRSITSVQSDIEIVGDYAFKGCNNLLTAVFPNAKKIGGYAFYGTALKSMLLTEITNIGPNAFAYCSGLIYLYIGPNASSIYSSAFISTSHDLVIDCGFSETDSVAANAPWGATHATINYGVAEPNPPAGI